MSDFTVTLKHTECLPYITVIVFTLLLTQDLKYFFGQFHGGVAYATVWAPRGEGIVEFRERQGMENALARHELRLDGNR